MAFMFGRRNKGSTSPTFPSIADQRSASAGRVAARGGNMSRTSSSFPSIAEQRARNIVSGQRNARGYNSGFTKASPYSAPSRPTFPSIADQRAASAGNYARRGVNLTGGISTSSPAGVMHGPPRPAGSPAGVMHGPPRPAGSPAGVMHGPPRPAGSAINAAQKANEDVIRNIGKKGKLLNNKGLMIGAGAAVIAGLAMNRRGDGTSSGRSGMTRY